MINLLNGHEHILNNIEHESIKIIQDKLNIFFDSCIKGSLTYSLMLSNHGSHYSEGSFEMMVLSSSDIVNLIKKIIIEIYNSSYYYRSLNLLNVNINIVNNIELNPVLIASIQKYSFSLNITAHCEDVINKMIVKGLELGFSSKVIAKATKSINIGAFILGKNNYENLQLTYQKEIHNQIEGILLNTKCSIKNLLINYIIRSLKINKLKSDEVFMITA